MRKIIISVMLSTLLLGMTSCKLTPTQIEVIANTVGMFSAVSWIAIDNPPTPVKVSVNAVVNVIKDSAKLVQVGETYSEVLYPIAVKIIDKEVEIQYRPLCKTGVSMMLGQLDILFAAHPEWKKDQDIALMIVVAFCDGVHQGLALSDDSPIIIQAKKNAAMRLAILGK